MEQKRKSKKIKRRRVKQKSRTKHQKYSNADKVSRGNASIHKFQFQI